MKGLCLKYGIVVCPKSEPTRQMMLGTNNQKKEPLPMKAHLPQLPRCLLLLPFIQMSPHIWEHPVHKSQLEYVP